jgi:hypothetical protein
MLLLGNSVSKTGGDYRFDGIVVAVFTKLSGVMRYVVEDDRGILHIFSERNLQLRNPTTEDVQQQESVSREVGTS